MLRWRNGTGGLTQHHTDQITSGPEEAFWVMSGLRCGLTRVSFCKLYLTVLRASGHELHHTLQVVRVGGGFTKGPGFSSCSQRGLEGFQALPPVTIRVIIQAVAASVCSWRLLRAAVSLGQLWNSSDHVERLRSLRSVLFVCTWMWVLLSAHGAWRPASNSRRVSCYCGEAAAVWWILLPGAALHAAAAFILQPFD